MPKYQLITEANEILSDLETPVERAAFTRNLDDEAANLLQWQQAYQASAQVLTVASSLFTTLIDSINGTYT